MRRMVSTCRYDLVQPREECDLPLCECLVEINIAIYASADTIRRQRGEFIIQIDAEPTELLVVGVAKCEHRVVQILPAWKVLQAQLLVEGTNRIGGLTITICAGNQNGIRLCHQR